VSETATSSGQLADRFDRLQEKLVDHWKVISKLTDTGQTIVVVPSISLEVKIPGTVLQAYEERFLFLLLLLRQPQARMVYITSQPILPDTVDYHLSLMPGVIPSHARRRLHAIPVLDGSRRPLTRKILDRPNLIERVRGLIPNPDAAHLIPFNTTGLEMELAVRLGIPMYGCNPKFEHFGTKSGSRRLFADEGVQHPLGRDGLHSVGDIVAALTEMRREKPEIGQVLTKWDEGVSGEGNAVVDLAGLPGPGFSQEAAAIEKRVRRLSLEATNWTREDYLSAFAERGGIVEQRIAGSNLRSPSVQLRITPLGDVQILSTHDQLLGGPSGQSYLGCRFPADRAYAPMITREALKVGKRLAREGVLGRFAVDFVVAKQPDAEWRSFAIEINLRKGGTTHPYLTLEFLTDGRYDPETATFTTHGGASKCYVSSDHCESELFRTLMPDDLYDFVIRHGLHFNHATQSGVVLNMISALTEHGRFGLTAVANSHQEAQELFEKATSRLHAEVRSAAADAGQPTGI